MVTLLDKDKQNISKKRRGKRLTSLQAAPPALSYANALASGACQMAGRNIVCANSADSGVISRLPAPNPLK